MVLTLAQKKANKKWREMHPEQYTNYKKHADKIFYEKHKEQIKQKQLKAYYFKQEVKRLLSINLL